MKIFTAIILSCSFLSSSLLLAQQVQQQPKTCPCKNCKCTAQSHCGCFSKRGCTCGENCSCGAKCDDRLLSLNDPSFHHGHSDEHDDEESV